MDALCCSPTAALQVTGSSAHTCQAASLAPWALRHSRAPLLHTRSLNSCAKTGGGSEKWRPWTNSCYRCKNTEPAQLNFARWRILLETLVRLALKVTFGEGGQKSRGQVAHSSGWVGGKGTHAAALGGKLPVTRSTATIACRFPGIREGRGGPIFVLFHH